MIEFQIRVAGRTAAVRCHFETSRRFCEKYLWDGEPDFSVEITQGDIDFEREKSAQEDMKTGREARTPSDAYLEVIAIHRKVTGKLLDYGILLFHGSVVAVDGAAYLFTAKSGTGKSTHTRLWRALLGPRAVMVNDDKPFLSIEKDRVLAHGSPWNGKHRLDTNIAVPLKAICILERGSDNVITPIRAGDALSTLFQQSSRPNTAAGMAQYMDLIDGIARNVAFFRLWCNMEPEAARVSYEGMSGERLDK